MSIVKDEVAHILRHVNAEAATTDRSQAPGVAARAQKVRDALANRVTDKRDLARSQLLSDLVSLTDDPELKPLLSRIDANDNGERVQLILAEWVGKNRFYKDAG